MVTGYNIAWYNTGEPHTVEAEFGEGEYRRRADAERWPPATTASART